MKKPALELLLAGLEENVEGVNSNLHSEAESFARAEFALRVIGGMQEIPNHQRQFIVVRLRDIAASVPRSSRKEQLSQDINELADQLEQEG